MRQEGGYETLESTHTKLLIFNLIETLAIVSITAWQVFYIKKILDNRRLI
jgi:hypothetical protein